MPCCKAYDWCKDAPIVDYKDEHDNEYCVFHAPAGKKGIPLKEFNRMVFDEINNVKALPEEELTGKLCDLSGTVFEDNIDFSLFEFPSIVFSKARFKKVNFGYATFSKIAGFSEAIFSEKADFRGAEFSERADFRRAEFSETADFSSTEFSKRADFRGAKFEGEADFSWAKFMESYFDRATFDDSAVFEHAYFSKRVDFMKAIFFKASFSEATFAETAAFAETSFNEVSFLRATFNKAVFFETKFHKCAAFRRTVIHEKLIFQNVNLAKISFLESDIRACDFINCDCSRKGERCRLFDEERYLLFDEERLSEHSTPDDIRKVESLYRAQKGKSAKDDNQFDYSLWHIGEKEMLRKRTRFRERPCLWSILNIYRFCSFYGEGPKRAFAVLLCLIPLMAILLGLAGLTNSKTSNNSEHKEEIHIFFDFSADISWPKASKLAVTTLEYLTFIKNVDMRPIDLWGRVIIVLGRIIIAIQAALFGMALRNLLRR